MFKVSELAKATGARLIRGRQEARVRGISIDSRSIKRGEAFIAIKGDRFDGQRFIGHAAAKGAGCIITAGKTLKNLPGNAAILKVRDTTCALGDIARFQRNRFDIPVIAVTGTNGKTTTKDMIAHILSKSMRVLKNEGTRNNQIGLPLTLSKLNARHDAVVLEIGTNHFGEVECLSGICSPNIGVITNIAAAHLEFFRDLDGVLREKRSLLSNLRKPYIALLNADDKMLCRLLSAKGKKKLKLGFSLKGASDFRAGDLKRLRGIQEFSVNDRQRFELKSPGYWNIYNALAAIAVARVLGMGYNQIARALRSFDFPGGRLTLKRSGNISFIDDTYNSNPVSLALALEALGDLSVKGRKIVVMGDMLELGDASGDLHAQAGREAAAVCDVFIAVGRLSGHAADGARSCGLGREKVFRCANSLQARRLLKEKLRLSHDDLVLVKGSRAMKMEEVIS
ncbi:UDP-N-acetylmuramoyl-tripeptide--D-alanyl-D-alanine ligase [Candidatus Omnitrophota bacterium]